MFDDLANLTGHALGREVMRELYGRDVDAPRAFGHIPEGVMIDPAWAVNVAHEMARVYQARAPKLGLPALVSYDATPCNDRRECDVVLHFRGGFRVQYRIADPLEFGMHTGLILHRIMRRAGKQKTTKDQYGRLPTW
jgi:hypothetical protein